MIVSSIKWWVQCIVTTQEKGLEIEINAAWVQQTDQCFTALKKTSDILENIIKGTKNITVNTIYAPT